MIVQAPTSLATVTQKYLCLESPEIQSLADAALAVTCREYSCESRTKLAQEFLRITGYPPELRYALREEYERVLRNSSDERSEDLYFRLRYNSSPDGSNS